MSENWAERAEQRLSEFAFLPWSSARGKPFIARVLIAIFGWLWVVPMMLLIVLPFFFLIVFPVSFWTDLRDGN